MTDAYVDPPVQPDPANAPPVRVDVLDIARNGLGARPGPRADLHAARTVRSGSLRRGRCDAHPAFARADARVLPQVRPAHAPIRDGQPTWPRAHRRPAHDRGGGEQAPG